MNKNYDLVLLTRTNNDLSNTLFSLYKHSIE